MKNPKTFGELVADYELFKQTPLDEYKLLQEIKEDAVKAWECEHEWRNYDSHDVNINYCEKCKLDDEALERIERSFALYPSLADNYMGADTEAEMI